MTSRGPLLTVDQVADQLALPAKSVRKLIRRGDLTAHNVGTPQRRVYRVSQRAIDDYLDARLAVPA